MDYIRLRGTGVSPGIAVGKVLLSESLVFTSRKEHLTPDQVPVELDRFQQALERTRQQLTQLKDKVGKQLGEEHSFIFESHLLILQDKSLVMSLKDAIANDQVKTEWAISQVHEKYVHIFDSIEDEYFRERKSDVTDVLTKLYRNLEPEITQKTENEEERILVAHDLLPSEAALRLSRGNILAVALDVGGTTSHTAILARSLNIPAVMGLRNITQTIKDDDILIVDGSDGEVLINPPQVIQREFLSKQKKYDDYRLSLQKTATLKAQTLDRFKFSPQANIELPEEVSQALALGAEGIGLFRSEFIYFQSLELPDEEDHFEIYSRLAQEAAPLPVHIRTIDIGGEKNLPQMRIEKEPNPALGLRAIRFSLRDREIFRIQIRAILRASVLKNVRILIPMITELEEVDEVKRLVEEEKQKLREQDIPFDADTPLGVMIEVPAAAALTDMIVQEVDYLSIGTNDLIQYYLAVDRSNELVSYLFKPLHPSVLRLLKFIIDCAEKEGKEVTVCGEMAADPLSAIFLLGLGLKNYSMNPIFIPRIKRALRSVEYQQVKKFVQKAMTLKTAQEVEEFFIESILASHPKALLMGEYPTNDSFSSS
jgi:phosphotransferase system enzyme I (PtsI)